MTFDQIRASHRFGLAVYAYEPDEPVTVEVISPDGTRFQASGLTLDSILQSLFPDPPVEEAPEPSIFD